MKDSWQTLNQLLNKRSQSTNIVSMKESNQTIFDKHVISNKMKEYFCSIGEKLTAYIAHTSNPLLSNEISVNGGGRIFDFREINERDIHDAMFKIKVKKSFGNDNISGYYIKITFPYVSRILMLIFNTSIEPSTFPVSWKIARVTLIYKEGEKSEKSNYRPISVLPVLSRLVEKLIYDQLYQYLERGGFLTSDQSGFRALHSSTTCLLKCTDNWYSGMDEGLLTGLISIGLKKLLILLIMKSFVKNWSIMVLSVRNYRGLNLTLVTENNIVELMVWIQIQMISI